MKMTVRIEGLSDAQEALSELPKQLQKPAMRRVLMNGAELIRAAAEAFAPRDTGELASSMVIATGFDSPVGKKEYGRVLKRGGTKRQAVAALRTARRQSSSVSIPFVWVGPSVAADKDSAIKRIVQEFGSKFQAPHPYLRPAWDTQKDAALRTIANELWPEIEKTAARYKARAERLAAKSK
jgi:HK97 gp10 family phage protein